MDNRRWRLSSHQQIIRHDSNEGRRVASLISLATLAGFGVRHIMLSSCSFSLRRESAFAAVRLLPAFLGAVVPLAAPAYAQAQPAAQNAPVTATLHPSALRQPIYGFGGSQTFNGDALADYPGREAVYKALFQELKLDIFRLRNYYDYPGQREKYEKVTREFASAARRFGDGASRGGKAPVRLLFTSWSPPPYLKSNNLVSGRSDGTDKGLANVTLKKGANGQYLYREFADWWLASVQNFRTLSGVYPDYITLQNELDWPVTYDGCEFLPSEGKNADGYEFAGYDRALFAVSDRMRAALGVQAPKILGPETFSIQLVNNMAGAPGAPNTPRAVLWADPSTPRGKAVLDRLFGVSYHIYGNDAESPQPRRERFHSALRGMADAYRPLRKPMFQTEFLEGDNLVSVAELINDTLTYGEASSYFVWISARTSRLPGHALVFYNPEDGSIERRERFYAMKHFSAFVGEGWNRIEATSSDPAVQLSAFVKAANREMVTVLINPTDQERRVTLAPEGTAYTGATTSIFRTSQGEGGERWRELGALGADNVVTLPKRSMATVRFVPAAKTRP